MRSPTKSICCCRQLKDTQKFSISSLVPRPEKQVCYLFCGCNGRIWSPICAFTCSWCSSLDQADLSLFLVHSSFVPICFTGSVWEKHLPLQHCFASVDLQELYKMKIYWRNEAVGRGGWLGKYRWSMDHPWVEQMEELSRENSVAGSGMIAKLPKSSVAATTAESHRADLFLGWSSYKE